MKKITLLVLLLWTAVVNASAAEKDPYQDGFVVASSNGDYRLKTNFFVQLQHQYLSIDNQGKTNSLQIRRGRFIFSGNAFVKELTYRAEFEFVGGLPPADLCLAALRALGFGRVSDLLGVALGQCLCSVTQLSV